METDKLGHPGNEFDWVKSLLSKGRERIMSWASWLSQHQLLCLILFFSFMLRLSLADLKSYWYDEILSVAINGSNHATLSSALEDLAAHSAHPPLYHAILYYWMKLFGTEEVATRTLSNLYVTGATLCLYLLALSFFGRRVAIASALFFALSYTATFYGLEVRSYAQSLFLVTLSSLLLWRWLDRPDGSLTWQKLFAGQAALLLCNIALLLTHYSNAFFVVVQLLFIGFYFCHRFPLSQGLQKLPRLALFYVAQFVVAAAIWGPAALSTQKRFVARTQYLFEGLPARTPPRIFIESVVQPSFDLPHVITVAVILLIAIVVFQACRRIFSTHRPVPSNQYFLVYLFAWATAPCILAYLLYFITGWERYVARYFAICVPPFSILLVLALEQIVKTPGYFTPAAWWSVRRHYLGNAIPYALLACAIFVLPGALKAAQDPKGLYRDIARSIVMLVEQDPQSSFAICEAARRKTSLLNHYLERFSGKRNLRVDVTARRSAERQGQDTLKWIAPKVAGRDYLIVAFPFDGASKFPRLRASLQGRYGLAFSQLDKSGRGYVVFRLSSAEEKNKR